MNKFNWLKPKTEKKLKIYGKNNLELIYHSLVKNDYLTESESNLRRFVNYFIRYSNREDDIPACDIVDILDEFWGTEYCVNCLKRILPEIKLREATFCGELISNPNIDTLDLAKMHHLKELFSCPRDDWAILLIKEENRPIGSTILFSMEDILEFKEQNICLSSELIYQAEDMLKEELWYIIRELWEVHSQHATGKVEANNQVINIKYVLYAYTNKTDIYREDITANFEGGQWEITRKRLW